MTVNRKRSCTSHNFRSWQTNPKRASSNQSPTKKKIKMNSTQSASYLSTGYSPTTTDVLCGRGKACTQHSGNQVFMDVVRSSLGDYVAATSRIDKSIVVRRLVGEMVDSGMRFLKLDQTNQRYVVLNIDQIHSKVGHAIRDVLKGKSPSKKKGKSSTMITKKKANKVRSRKTADVTFSATSTSEFAPPEMTNDLFSIPSPSPSSSDKEEIRRKDNNTLLPVDFSDFESKDIETLVDMFDANRRRSSLLSNDAAIVSNIVQSSIIETSSSANTMESLLKNQQEIFKSMINYESRFLMKTE